MRWHHRLVCSLSALLFPPQNSPLREIPQSKFLTPSLLLHRGPLVHNDVKAGDRIGVVGIGGLGHLAIQFASKLGYEVVVFSTTENKRAEAMKFGATEFHTTAGLTEFSGIKPIDHLLITTSTTPDLKL